jgi:hypothetical protein
MPFKANADRRHHIPQQKRKVTNWAIEHAREGPTTRAKAALAQSSATIVDGPISLPALPLPIAAELREGGGVTTIVNRPYWP